VSAGDRRAATHATAGLAGLVFGVGLIVSGMTQPAKVMAFLDVTGDWDPSLMLVMGGAIGVHVLFARRALRPDARPRLAAAFELPRRQDVDAPLLVGAALFGVGWGATGFCPGPALVSLATLSRPAVVFVLAMVAGSLLVRRAPPVASLQEGEPAE